MGSACRRRGASDTARQAGSGKRAALAGSAAGSGPGCRVAAVESWCGAQQRARDRAGFCAPETRWTGEAMPGPWSFRVTGIQSDCREQTRKAS
ncbi:uncharacterized protein LOC143273329 isoform X1 [Peromyscus maniculatus bairdii]|uniref:uncharacterized protein LOC143273329 isoform X1 n=1 Tax=Peromyscus maniculatus bairdii TaxID=230844 RepID=UPI003FD56F89